MSTQQETIVPYTRGLAPALPGALPCSVCTRWLSSPTQFTEGTAWEIKGPAGGQAARKPEAGKQRCESNSSHLPFLPISPHPH